MEDAKQKLLTRIQESNNVLVTVSANPSLDQLAGAVGMTLLLNKLGKHATAVFSGKIPSSIEYLKPEQTLERDTNSLRDFIIALDKAKADKLRYKVEDKVVKIFITPYRTSLSEKDLEFSQGDFNVDLVVAVGVKEAKDLDQAIVSHGRILHDATVSSVNNTNNGQLGTINWVNTKASSLCEMLYDLCRDLKADAVDPQMATAFLTGIVAETKRFSNEKTTAKTLDMSGQLVASGANQQLVAARLEIKPNDDMDEGFDSDKGVSLKKEDSKKPDDDSKGTLEINHTLSQIEEDLAKKREEGAEDDIAIDEHGNLRRLDQLPEPQDDEEKANEPAAQALPDVPPADGISKFAPPKTAHLPPLNSNLSDPQADVPDPSLYPTTPEPTQDKLAEEPVSPLGTTTTPDLSAARDAVSDAMASSPSDGPLPPRIDLNANPALEFSHPDTSPPPAPLPDLPPNLQPMVPPQPTSPPPASPAPPAPEPPAPSAFPTDLLAAVPTPTDNSGAPGASPLAPPPVPPPLMPTDFGSAPAPSGPPSPQPLTPLNPPQPPQTPMPPFPPAPQP